jgi:DNA-binding NarL/FixJ family response regulator
MIRILLVDDHVVVREALRMMLDQDVDMEVIGGAGDGKMALRMAEECAPDVVVMDVGLNGMSGIEATGLLRAAHPSIRVLALSSLLDRSSIQRMLDAGANGYIAKSAGSVELKQGIRSVARGQGYLCPETAAVVTGGLRVKPSPPGFPDEPPLSQRELQVVTLLAEGKSTPEIAAKLFISSSTVDVHRRNIMRKLGLHNVVNLTRYAIRTGLVSP